MRERNRQLPSPQEGRNHRRAAFVNAARERSNQEKNTKGASSRIGLREEYQFDYAKSRPNWFAARMAGNVVVIVLEPDVAAVFDSSKAVNELFRSVISVMPRRDRKSRGDRRKAS